MTTTTLRSLERIGFAAMVALLFAPVLFHAGWPLIASVMGFEYDAYKLTFAALGVAGGAILVYSVCDKSVLPRSIAVASSIGLGAAILLGNDVRSVLVMAFVFVVLAIWASTFIGRLVSRLPPSFDGRAKQHKLKTAFFVLLAVFAVGQMARLSTFMGDAKRVELSVLPSIPFLNTHSCFSSYVHASKLARAREKNLYDVVHWPSEKEQLTAKYALVIQAYKPFVLDPFMYPPQFLLLPAALASVSDNFLVQRALWYGFCFLLLILGFWLVAVWVGEENKGSVLWLLPLLWSSMQITLTLQIGNVHHAVIVMAILGMLAFEHKKPALGGALLSFAILSKIFPGLLGILLLAQRRWRDAAWTFAFGIVFTLLSLVFFGLQPLESFLRYEMPRLSSGVAVRWFETSVRDIVLNFGPFGLPFKFSLLGMSSENLWGTARLLNMSYTLSIVGLTIFVARRKRDRFQTMYLWLGILTLSALQSPFAPGYVLMPIFWILVLMITETKKRIGLFALAFLWVSFSVPLMTTAAFFIWVSLSQQVLVFGFLLFALSRTIKQAEPISPVSPVEKLS